MKITDVNTVLLTGPCTGDPFLLELREYRSAAFIEVHTDTEIIGLGETYAGYFCPEIVPQTVDFFKPVLIGQEVEEMDIGELWRRMYHCGNFWCRVGLGASVLSGIEAALWDLKGKIEQTPVCELLGENSRAAHEELFGYATGGPTNFPADRLTEKLDFYRSLGFVAAKLGIGSYSREDGSQVAADAGEAADFEARKLNFVREQYGGDFRLMLDGHMGNSSTHTWNTETAITVARACEPYDLFFFEEPLHYTDPWGYAELCAATTVPIAGGECLTADYEWRVFIERDCFDIGQPDAGFMGGLGEFMTVARRFAERDRNDRHSRLGRERRAHAEHPLRLRLREHHDPGDPTRLRSAALGDRRRLVSNACRLRPAADNTGTRHRSQRRRQGTVPLRPRERRIQQRTRQAHARVCQAGKTPVGFMKKIFVNLRADDDQLANLRATAKYEIDVVDEHVEEQGIALPPDRIADAEILLCDFPPANIDEMKKLEFIQLASVGYTQLAGLGLAERGIRVSNARGVFDVPIAEWNIAMMINLARDLRGMIRNQDSGTWDRAPRFQTEIRGRTVGIWGYGGIGRETARMAKMLGMKVHAMVRSEPGPTDANIYGAAGTGDPTVALPDRVFLPKEKEQFLADLDFLILAMPMSPENEGIISAAELQMLPAQACLLNPARGPLIREAALLQALKEGWIAAAAIDTHHHYPMPPEHPLWDFPNVIMTPHISGSSGSPHYLRRVWDIFAKNLARVDNGRPLLNALSLPQIQSLD